jgi:hypothetical protein
VFTGPSGSPMRRSNFNKAVKWHEVCGAIGVPHLRLHDLRHTGNTLAAGTPGTSTRSDGADGPQHDARGPDLSARHPGRRSAHRRGPLVRNRAGRGGRVGHAANSTWTARRVAPLHPPPQHPTCRPRKPGLSGRICRVCGCSSMAEHQLPKLTVRVRFPSPAQSLRPRFAGTTRI